MARALFIDDEKVLVDIVERFAQRLGWPLETRLYNKNSENQEIPPDTELLICDGLYGKWKDIYEAARNSGVNFVLYSSDNSAIKDAERMGVKVIEKKPASYIDTFNSIFEKYLSDQ